MPLDAGSVDRLLASSGPVVQGNKEGGHAADEGEQDDRREQERGVATRCEARRGEGENAIPAQRSAMPHITRPTTVVDST